MRIKDSSFRESDLEFSDVWIWSAELLEPEDSLIPYSVNDQNIAEADTFLIRGRLTTATGDNLQGLVVYSPGDGDVFAIEVLTGNQKFTFNKYLPELSRQSLGRLAKLIGQREGSLLPIKYHTVSMDVIVPDGAFSF